jgi:hypothetical protein
MADSNIEEAPIGRVVPKLKLKGVSVTKATAFGVEAPTIVQKQVVRETTARNVSLMPIVRKTQQVAVSSKVTKGVTFAAPDMTPTTTTVMTKDELMGATMPEEGEVEEQVDQQVVAEVKQRMAGTRKLAQIPLPPDEEIMTKQEFVAPENKALVSVITKGADPIEAKSKEKDAVTGLPLYRPISSPLFHKFIVQTFSSYSQLVMRVLAEGKEKAQQKKEIDPDACKRRDPNKVETFYYQKFVRDYLFRGSPYRGLLVYHGLGSGKTCTSIAAAEALYWGGQKTIYVLTPATLSNNYRRELGKCGYFPLRQNNYWKFLASGPLADSWLTSVLGLPADIVKAMGGGWVADPTKPSNWNDLAEESREAIRAQQQAHLNHRFKFIHYNGVTPAVLARLAGDGVASGRSMFDDVVIIVDEIHNLVRTINGTEIGSRPISKFMETREPREYTWTTPTGRERPGFRYPRGYTLYRLIQNAVGAKIIALSATPMINYAQEFAILMNMVGGEQRLVEIALDKLQGPNSGLEAWARQRPDVDFYSIEENENGKPVLVVTPVPFGFSKVVGDNFDTRGFVRTGGQGADPAQSRERNMDRWAQELVTDLVAKNMLPVMTKTDVEGAVAAALGTEEGYRAAMKAGEAIKGYKGVVVPATKVYRTITLPMLPDDPQTFVQNFVDRNTLRIVNPNVLKARAAGLISYYKGGSEDLMPRVTVNEVVSIPMSDYMFQEYTRARNIELEMEPEKPKVQDQTVVARKGMTAAEADLYTQATKTQSAGFLALSRAACNWVFPEDVERPGMRRIDETNATAEEIKAYVKEQTKLLGITEEGTIAVDKATDVAEPLLSTSNVMATHEDEAEQTEAVLPDEVQPTTAEDAMDPGLRKIVGTLLAELESRGAEFLMGGGLATFSPKYATILAKVQSSPGPTLVYSQFKTLEGLGIFAAALRAAGYLPLDLQKDAEGDWVIPDVLMEVGRPRYVLYTGDQDLEKRRLLLQLYNADVTGLPPKLSAQCATLLDGAPDNRDGRICRVFMITQSGAEGISLFNTRQVHVMEPYWNNVRLQQVIGRAIRLCSHMNLPLEERTVEVYTYLSTFSKEQKGEGMAGGKSKAAALMMADKGLTTDEMIYAIAQAKQQLADGLFEIAQSSAVDCLIHHHEHGKVVQCFRFDDKNHPLFMYHPDWRKDLVAASVMRTK